MPEPGDGPAAADGRPTGGSVVRSVYREVLGCGAVSASDTFVGLGGDSLSYVEVAMVLEEHLGELPEAWHLLTVGELEEMEPSSRRVPSVETNVGLRAAAIALVVGTHAGVFAILGGAHLLLAVAGYNFARFQVGATGSGPRAAGADEHRPHRGAGRAVDLDDVHLARAVQPPAAPPRRQRRR